MYLQFVGGVSAVSVNLTMVSNIPVAVEACFHLSFLFIYPSHPNFSFCDYDQC
jgi:hypothetical protein